MAFTLPEKVIENNLDDIQSADFDIESLYNKFIAPIEAVRSISAPTILQNPRGTDEDGKAVQRELDHANVNIIEAQESRAHAFYRCIGLPVVDQDYNIYNPGFNPKRTEKARIQSNSVADRVSQTVKLMTHKRESQTRNRHAVFQQQGLNASIYALVLPIIKKFQVLDKNKDFTVNDEQQFSIPERKLFLNNNYTGIAGALSSFYESGGHILRPMVCDASIERTVMPATRLICEPFLTSVYDTVLELDTLLQRPKIEQIIKLRLSNFNPLSTLDESIFIMDKSVDTNSLSLPDLRRIALALLDENDINDKDLLDRISVNNTELIQLNNLVRTIKSVIDLLVAAVETISWVGTKIDWTPLPSVFGPEFGTDLGSFIIKKNGNSSTELERRITQLSLKSQNSKRRFSEGELNMGSYALNSFESMEKLFDDELASAKEMKYDYIRRGSNALRTIEIITGEISGLGLIDILAVYAAMWSIDLDVLISLLDNNAFSRLYENNVGLRNSNVTSRFNNGPKYNGYDAINKLEQQVTNILAFADRLVELKLASPKLSDGGSI